MPGDDIIPEERFDLCNPALMDLKHCRAACPVEHKIFGLASHQPSARCFRVVQNESPHPQRPTILNPES